MRPTFLNIPAANSADAKASAVEQFGCAADDIVVASLGTNQFRAELVNQDADLSIVVAPNKMMAAITASIPAKGRGRSLTLEDLIQKLKSAGVRVAPDADIALRVVEQLRRGGDVTGMVVARGIPPTPPKDASIIPVGDWEYPVFPGDAFGQYVPRASSQDGILVTGEIYTAMGDNKTSDILFAKDCGCHLDQSMGMVMADRYGLVVMEGLRIQVKPLTTVADGRMTVRAPVYHRTFRGDPTTPQHYQIVLDSIEATAGLKKNAVLQALEKAKQNNAPVSDVALCHGTQPRDGMDGRFEPATLTTEDVFGTETADGRIDFRARGVVRSVKAGDLLGRIIPPMPGIPGMDVFGLPTPPRQGKPFKLILGENVQAGGEDDEFYATSEGMIYFQGNNLKVTETFETRGDVNLVVGNIKLERGSVHVRGSVLSGFRVEAPGNIVVKDVVENAVLIAGGDVQVGCGIVMDQGGQVAAGGGISAGYAQNATLRAGGDVNVAHEVNNCKVFAARSVIATRGRGKIFGGEMRCGEGVLAREIGSPLGVETLIYLGVERKTEVNLARKKELEETLQNIYASLGTGDIRAILEKTPPEKRQIVAEVLKARVRCEQELRDIENQILQEREQMRSSEKHRVKALHVIHPDVIVHCFRSRFKVTKPLANSTIYFDSSLGRLVLA